MSLAKTLRDLLRRRFNGNLCLNSANIWSQIVTGLGAISRRLRKVSHSAAVAMKYSRDRLACKVCDEGQL
jgi:hypothetical protein